jgi:hypothetical protein
MSFMAVRVSILFMTELDLWLSAEGGGRQNTVDHFMTYKNVKSDNLFINILIVELSSVRLIDM